MHAISLLRFPSEKAGNRRSDPPFDWLESSAPGTAMPLIVRNGVLAELTQGASWIRLVLGQLWIVSTHSYPHRRMVTEKQKELGFVFRNLALQFHIIPMLPQ